jgi:hypothetical protein
MLHKMEPLGARKPSKLMSHMLEICPRGQEKNEFSGEERILRRRTNSFSFCSCNGCRESSGCCWVMISPTPGTSPPRPIVCWLCMCMTTALWRRCRRRSRYRFQLLPSSERASIAGPIGAEVRASGIVAAEAGLLRGDSLPPPLRLMHRLRVPRPGSQLVCATFTGRMATRPTDARHRAVGETDAPGRLNAIPPGTLVYLQDSISQRCFLVDTRASYSIFPFTSGSTPMGPYLTGPSGKTIPC